MNVMHLVDIGETVTYCDKPMLGLPVTFHTGTATCPDCIDALSTRRAAQMTRQQFRALLPWLAIGAVQALLIGIRASGVIRWHWWLVLLPLWLVLLLCALMYGSLAMWAGADHE
jgi:hypothetical protein